MMIDEPPLLATGSPAALKKAVKDVVDALY